MSQIRTDELHRVRGSLQGMAHAIEIQGEVPAERVGELIAALREHADSIGDAIGYVPYETRKPTDPTPRQKLLERLRRGGFEEHDIKLTESGHDFVVCLDAMEIFAAETLQ